MGEFQMIRPARMAEHDTVEAIMVLKSADQLEAQALSIKAKDVVHVVCRASNT